MVASGINLPEGVRNHFRLIRMDAQMRTKFSKLSKPSMHSVHPYFFFIALSLFFLPGTLMMMTTQKGLCLKERFGDNLFQLFRLIPLFSVSLSLSLCLSLCLSVSLSVSLSLSLSLSLPPSVLLFPPLTNCNQEKLE